MKKTRSPKFEQEIKGYPVMPVYDNDAEALAAIHEEAAAAKVSPSAVMGVVSSGAVVGDRPAPEAAEEAPKPVKKAAKKVAKKDDDVAEEPAETAEVEPEDHRDEE